MAASAKKGGSKAGGVKPTAKKARAETGTPKARKRTAKKVPTKRVSKPDALLISEAMSGPPIISIVTGSEPYPVVIDDRPPQAVQELPETTAQPPRKIVDRDAPGGPFVDFGKHIGAPYCKVPRQYLEWMINAGHNRIAYAREELRRRNVNPRFNVVASPSAIDVASLQLHDLFENTRKNFEGLYTWLCRIVADGMALKDVGEERGTVEIEYDGNRFIMIPHVDPKAHYTKSVGYEITNIIPRDYKIGFNRSTKAASDQAGKSHARRTRNIGSGVR